MKSAHRFAAIASIATALALAAPASAQLVTYTTTGQFSGGGATCNNAAAAVVVTCSVGGSFIQFNGAVNAVISPAPAFFGTFYTAAGPSDDVYAGITFTMYVSQIAPSSSAGADQIVSSPMNGTLSFFNSTLMFTPNPAAFILGSGATASYTIPATPILPPTREAGLISIIGTVVTNSPTTTVPEPGTYGLLVAGLAAIGLVARRRRAA